MLLISIDQLQIDRLHTVLDGKGNLKKELSIAINTTAKTLRGDMSKTIRGELAVKKKDLDKTLRSIKLATAASLSANVELQKTARIPLRDFGANQNKTGVGYRLGKKQGRRTAVGAFQGPRPGAQLTRWRGRVFRRVGKTRLPIVQLHGPSAWGVWVKGNLSKPAVRDATAELKKQIERRIRYNVLKASGQLRGRQPTR